MEKSLSLIHSISLEGYDIHFIVNEAPFRIRILYEIFNELTEKKNLGIFKIKNLPLITNNYFDSSAKRAKENTRARKNFQI